MNRGVFRLSFALLASTALCACSPHLQAQGPGAGLPPAISPAASKQDDWLTFGRDYDRTGFQPNNVGLNLTTVKHLKLRWRRALGSAVYAGPVAYNGNLIVVTLGEGGAGAVISDFRASDGALLWTRHLSGGVRATPSIDPGAGELFVSDRMKIPGPSHVYAIRLIDGSIAWQAPVPGITHASPLVAGGSVYVGISGGDYPACVNGGIMAFDEQTGAPRWRWQVNQAPNGGGSVWGAIAYDGAHIIVGTGNTCTAPLPTANGAVALNLDGTVAWTFTAQKNASSDDDTGSGVLISGGRATFMSKDGSLYSVGEETGALSWATPLGAGDTWGGYATPSTDGATIVVGAGLFCQSPRRFEDALPKAGSPNDVIPNCPSRLDALDTNGVVRWSRPMTNRMTGDAAIVSGMAITGVDKAVAALDLKNGKIVWSYPTKNYLDASPIVVPSGVYTADDSGNVYAFSIP